MENTPDSDGELGRSFGVRPLFWKVRNQPIFFLASMHFGPPGGFDHGPQVREAFDQSEIVHFEVTRDELSLVPELVRRETGSLNEELGDQLYAKFRADPRYDEGLEQVKLPFALMGLATKSYLEIGLTHENGVEQKLYERAANNGQQIAGLEGATDQIRSLSGFGVGLVTEGLRQILEHPDRLIQMRDLVVEGYVRGNERAINAARTIMYQLYPEVADCVLTARENRWAPKLRDLVREGRPAMVVVGALHLVGDHSILAPLIRDGLEIETAV